MFSLFSNKKQEKGQGLVEYAIILALIAIVVIAVMTTLGKKVCNTMDGVSNSLDGGTGSNCGATSSGSESSASTGYTGYTSAAEACASGGGGMAFPHPDGTWSLNAVETLPDGNLMGTSGAGVICN